MKSISDMDQAELAAYVQSHLRKKGIQVVLSGGAAVALYSEGLYVSKDLDMVNIYEARRRNITSAMSDLGFSEYLRYFTHPDTKLFIDFVSGPLAIGKEPLDQVEEIEFSTGVLRVISPTDCVKDRLAAFYYWGDHQCLEQATMVSQATKIDIKEIERWSRVEGKLEEFQSIRSRLVQNAD
jgi:hypothetical protein